MTIETEQTRGNAEETEKQAWGALRTIGEQGRVRVNAIRDLGKTGLENVKARGNTVRERGESLVREVEGRLQGIRGNGVARMERVRALADVTALTEKLRTDRLLAYGLDTRNDVYRNLGIVPRKDFEVMIERLHAVEASLGDVAEKNRNRKEPAVPPKKTAATREAHT